MASRALSVLSLLALTAGYSFDLLAPPTQCGPLSIKINGGSGKPPYTALIVPYGANPNPNGVEQRTVISKQFSGESANFTLPYPANANFVIMLGDTEGPNTGGTSVPTNVKGSSDTSCLPSSVAVQFSFQILPNTAINQCTPAILAWNSSAQDPVTISLVIPGGQSQDIPLKNVGQQQGSTTGFSWTPNVPAGTNIILVANDKRGPGTGGSVNTVVGNNNINGDNSCINGQSPSSTAGTPAGAIETGSSGHGQGGGGGEGGGGSSTNIGAIVGGVVGGIVALLILGLVAWFLIRRRRQRRHPAAHGVDLLPEGAQRDPDQPAEFYTPEPYIVPPSQAGADENGGGTSMGRPSMSDAGGRRYSALSTDPSESTGFGLGAGAASGSTSYAATSSRKSPAGPPQLRPVNFVQHEDAGEVDGGGSGQPAETIELPPSYTSVRR